MNGHEARAEAVDAGEILVAARLIDAPLASEFGLERLDRHAVGDAPAIAAAFADGGIDEGADGRIGPFAALAQAPPLGRARLVVEDDRDALELAEFALRLVHRVAVAKGDARGQGDAGVASGVVGDERHLLHPLRCEFAEDLDRRHGALDRLSAGHRDEAVEEDLVGDRHVGCDRLADRERTGMGVGAVADVGEHVILARERLLSEPHRPFAAHVRSGRRLMRIDQRRHPVAADARERPAALGHGGRTVVRAPGAEARAAHRRRAVAELCGGRFRRAQRAVRIVAGNRLDQHGRDEIGRDLAEIGKGRRARRTSKARPSKYLPTIRGARESP